METKTIKVKEIMTGKLTGFVGNGNIGFASISIVTANQHYLTLIPAKGYIKVMANTLPRETEVTIDYTI